MHDCECVFMSDMVILMSLHFLFILTRNSGGDSKYILELRNPLIGMDFLLGKNSDHKVLTIIPACIK